LVWILHVVDMVYAVAVFSVAEMVCSWRGCRQHWYGCGRYGLQSDFCV